MGSSGPRLEGTAVKHHTLYMHERKALGRSFARSFVQAWAASKSAPRSSRCGRQAPCTAAPGARPRTVKAPPASE